MSQDLDVLPENKTDPASIFGSAKYIIGVNTQFAFEGLFDQHISTPFEVLIRKILKDNQD